MQTPLYRIKHWKRHFEVNRSRELKHARWVPVPNKHDGEGYTDLIMRPNGPELFGGWNLIIQVASKCDPRGTLVKDEGKPHDPASLSRKTRAPSELFEKCIPVLLEIGWMEIVKQPKNKTCVQIPQEGAEIPQEGATIPQEGALQTDRTGITEQTEQTGESSGLTVGGKDTAAYLKLSGISEALSREGNGKTLRDRILAYPLERIKRCWEYAQKADRSGSLKKPPLAFFQSLLRDGFTGPPTAEEEAQEWQEDARKAEEIKKKLHDQEKDKHRDGETTIEVIKAREGEGTYAKGTTAMLIEKIPKERPQEPVGGEKAPRAKGKIPIM